MAENLDDLAAAASRTEKALAAAAVAGEAIKKAIAGISSSARDAKNDLESISDAAKKFTQGTLALVKEVADAWRKVGEAIAATFQAAAQGERHEASLRRLGSAYGAVASATRGTVSAEQALRTQQTLTQAGLELSTRELATVTRAAREYARAIGGETPQALDQLVDALRTGEANGLARFGVRVDATGTAVDRARAAIEQLASAQRGSAPSTETLSESQEKLTRSLDEAKEKIALAIVQTSQFPAALNAVTAAIPAVAEGLASIVSVATRVATAIAGVIASMAGFANAGRGLLSNAFGGGGGPQVATYRGVARVEATEIPDGLIGQNGPGFGESSLGLGLSADVSAAASALAARGRRGGGGGGGPKYDEAVFQELQFRVNELANRVRGTGVAVDRVVREQGERLDAFLGRQTQAIVDAVGGDAERVIRHHGETLEAFVGRQLGAVQTVAQRRLDTIRTIDEAIRREREQQAQADAEYVRQLEKINAQVERAMDRAASFDEIINNPQGQLDREAEQLKAQIQRGELTVEAIELRIRAAKAEALAEGTTDREAEALLRKAQMLGRVRDETLSAMDAQEQFNSASEQHRQFVETFSASVSSTLDKTFSSVTGALTESVGALIDGEEITAEVFRRMVHNTTKQIALMALAEGTLELARGLGKLATSYGTDGTAYGHFAAAGVDLGLAAAFGLTSYATRDYSKSTATGGTGGGARNQSSAYDRGGNSSQSPATNVYNFTFASATYGTTEELQDSVVRGLSEASRRNSSPSFAPRNPAWVG